MKTNKKLLSDFLEAEKLYRKQEKRIERYFSKQVENNIKEATTLEQLQEVKEFLRNMPQIVAKVCIFRAILMRADEISAIKN